MLNFPSKISWTQGTVVSVRRYGEIYQPIETYRKENIRLVDSFLLETEK